MKFIPLIKTCVKALIRNPMRASLTVLGIIIGIASVIALMEIGRGATEQIKSTMSAMGGNTLNVRPGSVITSGVRSGAGGRASLTPSDAEAIAEECPSVIRATPVMNTGGQIVYGNVNWNVNRIEGGTVDYLKIRDWYDVEEGEPYSDEDVASAKRVCLVGSTIVQQVFGGKSPVGAEVRIKDVSFKVIGVLKAKGANMMGWDQDDCVVMPWTSIRFRLQGLGGGGATGSTSTSADTSSVDRSSIYASSTVDFYVPNNDTVYTGAPHPRRFNNIGNIMVQIADPDNSAQSIAEVSAVLRQRHRLEDGTPDDFDIRDMAEFSRMMRSTSENMTQLLMIVAMISLVVGGVGIMNIMMVSVTERTREIGLRMAVGARGRDIMRQFLLESILLCLVGGAIGIAVGRVVSIIVSKSAGWAIAIVPEAMVLAVGVSVAIGCIFGFYPAWKASLMDPIDALRHE